MTARLLLLGVLATGCGALAGCAGALDVPETVEVAVPVACISPAERPARPATRTESDLMAMDHYRRTLAAWSDLKKLERYAGELEALVEGCSRIAP
jgi:hypothetical protein